MQYTGAASVASGTTLTISEENLAALSAGLKLADSYGDVSVGGKLIGLSDGNLSASGGVLTITPDAGSTVVKLSNAYLRSLSLGQHTLKLSYADGQSITATISVVETPVTGDNNQLAGFAFLMAGFSCSALALLYLLKKRRA